MEGVRAKWSMASTLIVNSKPGGHAAIGYYLAKELVTAGHDVALFNAGSKDKLGGADPFASYPDLEKIGVSIAWGDPASKEIGSVLDSAFGNRSFDVIYENNSKAVEDITPLVEYAQGESVVPNPGGEKTSARIRAMVKPCFSYFFF